MTSLLHRHHLVAHSDINTHTHTQPQNVILVSAIHSYIAQHITLIHMQHLTLAHKPAQADAQQRERASDSNQASMAHHVGVKARINREQSLNRDQSSKSQRPH
jgi:hypothetical protein